MSWIELLRAKVDATSQVRVARELSLSQSTISQVLKGVYNASTEHIAKRVMEIYGRVICPHLDREIPGAECLSFRTRPIPTSNHRALDHWAACQACPNNPKEKA